MAEDLVPLNMLAAVNQLLVSIGEQPVATLEDPGLPVDVSLAKNLITETSRNVQTEGWNFNTDYDYPLTPDINGNIAHPSNVLKFDAMPAEQLDLVQRGTRVYNRKDRTFTFTKTVKCEVTWFFPFDELPSAARSYITIRAARVFQDRTVGAVDLHGYQAQDEATARVLFEQASAQSEDSNVLADSNFCRQLYYR